MKKVYFLITLILAVGIINFYIPTPSITAAPDASRYRKVNIMTDWKLEAARNGNYVNKIGDNPDIDTGTDPEDMWDYGGTYVFSSTANIQQISSSDNSDTQELTVIGLNASWAELIQTAELTGTAGASLETPLIRVYMAYNSDSTDLVGDVYVSTASAVLTAGVPVSTEVRAMIRAGNNQTFMNIYTVPAGKNAYFINGYVAMADANRAGAAVVSWRIRQFGGVFRKHHKVAIFEQGSSWFVHQYGIPPKIPEKTDIKCTIEEVTEDNTAIDGSFSLYLEDN